MCMGNIASDSCGCQLPPSPRRRQAGVCVAQTGSDAAANLVVTLARITMAGPDHRHQSFGLGGKRGAYMRQVFESVTDVSLWLASQGFMVALLVSLIPYALITFPVQYWIRRLLAKHEF